MSKISADPSKEFFISMLTRDISLESAIIDLVDNSVDAAISAGSLVDRRVELIINKDFFEISDNCGGISKEAAEGYAFRFGRPADAPLTPHSVGRFGVGMKRALFKMGEVFVVESNHKNSNFSVSVDVNEWLLELGSWKFELIENGMFAGLDYGARIRVSKLHPVISERFIDPTFVNKLEKNIGKAHYKAIRNGFKIYVNGRLVEKRDIDVYASDALNVGCKTVVYENVKVSIAVGVGERNYSQGGWYIFCNDRLIEDANKGFLTGWGVDGLRNYHPDFAFFRGVVEFTSEDGSRLPWNTTKTGIDNDNPIYRSAMFEMKRLMRKVCELLKERVKEDEAYKEGVIKEMPINTAIAEANVGSIFNHIGADSNFKRPIGQFIGGQESFGRINYSVSKDDLDRAKESLGVATNKSVGELTFEYYLENECD